MKKLISVVLCLCMLMGCVSAFADGIKAHVTVSSLGETEVDITATVQTDEDGCYQVTIDGVAEDDPISVFLQVGTEALVLGSQGEYAKINYDALIAAVQNVLPEALSDEQLMVVGAIYYLLTSAEGDIAIAEDIAEDEITRLLNLGMTQGIISYGRGGTITIEADQDQLLAFAKAYLAALAEDETVYAKIASTEIWSLAKLEGKEAEVQQSIAALAEALDSVSLEGVEIYVKAVIGMDGTVDATLSYNDTESNLNASIKYDGETISMDANGTITIDGDSVTIEASLNGSATQYTVSISEIVEDKADISFELEAKNIDGVITETGTYVINMYPDEDYAVTTVENISLTMDLNNCEFNLAVTENITSGNEALALVNIEVSADKVNGLYAAFEYTYAGSLTAVYLKANAQATEYGAIVANANVDVVIDNEEIDNVFNLDIVITDVITAHCEMNSYKTYGEADYYENWCQVPEYDVLLGYDYEYYTADQYESIKDSLVDGAYNVFTFDATLDLNDAKLDATLTLGEDIITLTGEVIDGYYTLVLSEGGYQMATCELQLIEGMPAVYSVILGELKINLMDMIKVTRETNMTDNGIAWVFTVEAYGETTEIEVGVRDISENGKYNYELYMNYADSEYVAGVIYEQSETAGSSEIYVEQRIGGNVTSYLDVTAEVELLSGNASHVDGEEIPQEYLESLLYTAISTLSEELDKVIDSIF